MSRPVHFEIYGDDPEAATAFYSAVFGWKVDRWGEQPYWLLSTGEQGPGIDGAAAPTENHGQQVVLIVEVDDLTSAIDRVREAGGTADQEPAPIPGVGLHAYVRDPNGVVVGLLQPMREE